MTQKIRGQSLFELVIAIGVAAVIIVALVSVVTKSIRNANFSKNKAQATNYALDLSEWLRNQRDGNSTVFFAKATEGTTYCMPNTNAWPAVGNCSSNAYITDTIFKRSVTFHFSQVTVGTELKNIYKADINVIWVDGQGTHNIVNSTQFSDWSQR